MMGVYKGLAAKALFNKGILIRGGVLFYRDAATDVSTEVPENEAIQINAEALILQQAEQYSINRKSAYNLLNQDEMRYDDLVNTTTTWQDAIAAIKVANPKP